jgi:hypothetical protein
MTIFDETEQKPYQTKQEQLLKKLEEKERKRPFGVRKKDWKKK